jgi:hypothetical protein
MADGKVRSRQPAGLGVTGRRLWSGVVAEFELDLREQEILRLAARQLDDVARLEQLLARDGPMAEGSQGQPRLSQVVGELRQSRIAASRLLGELRLPDADEKPRTARSLRAERAANSRWDRTAQLREARRSGGAAS